MTSKFEISSIIKRKTLGLTLVLSAASLAFAQQKTQIWGEVTGPQNVKIPYASVNFINTTNKTASDAVLTGENGKYTVSLMPGSYTVSIEAIDFKKYTEKLIVTGSPSVKNFSIVAENTSLGKTQNIEGVTITAQNTKPYRVELDKKIYDPATDLISKGGNLQDVLSNVPSISVDTDGTVSMRGNTNIKFLINGKPSAMLGIDEGADALKSIPADQIERIEVITNPSSKFEASGTAGILNIILKKSKKLGFNGSVTGTVGYLPQTSLNTNLSWKRGAWSYFINGGGGYSRSKFVNNQEYRSLLLPKNMKDRSTFYSKQDNDGKGESNSYNVTTGFVVDLTEKSALNASVMFRNFKFDSNDTGNYLETFVSKTAAGSSLYDQTTNR
ncbi:MAG: TonB-dependent receptor, partial [Kaistella sp.]|nr:TonB-dependent receptor [Kaistella sp.]